MSFLRSAALLSAGRFATRTLSTAAEASKNGKIMGTVDEVKVRARRENQKAFIASVVEMIPRWIKGASIHKANDRVHQGGEIVLDVDPENTVKVLKFLQLHSSSQFKCFIDCTAVDYPERKDRFRVLYNVMSTKYNARIRVQTCVDELTPIESATGIYPGADWFEREVWDLYGVFFHSHPDLRRILTDYGFEGHPQRKDFPLSGYVEVRYDDTEKRVVTEPVEITQEYRSFDYTSPWEVFSDPNRPKELPTPASK